MVEYLLIVVGARRAKVEQRGASAVEYGVLIAAVAALIVVVVFAFGARLKGIFITTCRSLASSSSCG